MRRTLDWRATSLEPHLARNPDGTARLVLAAGPDRLVLHLQPASLVALVTHVIGHPGVPGKTVGPHDERPGGSPRPARGTLDWRATPLVPGLARNPDGTARLVLAAGLGQLVLHLGFADLEALVAHVVYHRPRCFPEAPPWDLSLLACH